MIKSLLDADENPPEGTKVIIEETTIDAPLTAGTPAFDQSADDAADILELAPAGFDTTGLSELPETPLEKSNAALPKVEESAVPFQSALYEPESQAETARKSGLAYAAGITLFFSVVFMMIIGWGADLLFGTSPWGIVGGIVLGALVGFVQFFRLTSQILKNKE